MKKHEVKLAMDWMSIHSEEMLAEEMEEKEEETKETAEP